MNIKNKLRKHMALGAMLSAGFFSTESMGQTPLEDFLSRAHSMEFNTSVLNSIESSENDIQTYMGLPATNINIDTNALFTLNDFQLELPGLENFYAIKDKIIENSLGGENWIGDVVLLDPTGFLTEIQGRAYFVENESGISGTIHTAEKVFQIYPDGAGGQVVVSQDQSHFDREDESLLLEEGNKVAASPLIAGRRDGQNAATMENPYTIDMLWVTTPLARESAEDIQALIELATLNGNDVLENSEIPARLRIVGIHHGENFEESPNNMRATHNALISSTDGILDEVHQIRSELGADVVATVSGATNYCGIGVIDAEPTSPFNITAFNCMSGYTFIHEIGHNMGAYHNIETGHINPNYTFGQGLQRDDVSSPWRTVMSYRCQSVTCARVPYFSNPHLTQDGEPLGNIEDADNSRVWRVRIAEVAGYQPSLTSDCTEHSATNTAHVNENRATTRVEGQTCFGTICFGGTIYYDAVGSGDNMGTSGLTNTTLAEEPAGFYSVGSCGTQTTETQFGPEIQNLQPFVTHNGLRIDGEVFDANADAITSVQARISGQSNWSDAVITIENSSQTFSVQIEGTVSNDTSVDFRTEDINGDTFEFSTIFELDLGLGESPILTVNDSVVIDDTIRINGTLEDSDSDTHVLRYKLGGTPNPSEGHWVTINDPDRYWGFTTDSLPTGGFVTVHLYAYDDRGNSSGVTSVGLDIPNLEAPTCHFSQLSRSTSRVVGELDIAGTADDINRSAITFETRVNGGTWTEIGNFSEGYAGLRPFIASLPDAYAVGATVNVELRATDSTNLQTHCGSQSITISNPTSELPPTCEITDVFTEEGYLRLVMTASDPNGDAQQMFSKIDDMSEWLQTWPSPITLHSLPVPDFGELIVQGRVLDAQGNEGFCEANYTHEDSYSAPWVNYASGYYSIETASVLVNADIRDNDGDVERVIFIDESNNEYEGELDPTNLFKLRWTADLGVIANGDHNFRVVAIDSNGSASQAYLFTLYVEQELPPSFSEFNYVIEDDIITVSGTVTDPNDDSIVAYIKLNNQSWNGFSLASSQSFTRTFKLPTGDHVIQIYLEDRWELRSEIVTINFTIENTDPCFIDTNANHVNAGRAEIIKEGETCYGTFCFGGTDTYFTVGSGENLGTDASATTSLIESNTGYFELSPSACPDTTPPVITIPTGTQYEVTLGSSISAPVAQAIDNVDGDISDQVVTTGVVNPNQIGTYHLYYNVSDTAGNEAEEVVVTFDVVDGPTTQCFSDTIENHISAGRAEIKYNVSYYAVVPSGQTADYLGSTSLDGQKVVTLEEIAPGHWDMVTSCN